MFSWVVPFGMVAVWLSVPVPLIVQATGTVIVAVETTSSAFVLFDNKNAPESRDEMHFGDRGT